MSSSSEADAVLPAILDSLPAQRQGVVAEPGRYNLQIVYSQVDRDEHNRPVFTHYRFRADPASYFYPASLVKLPIAALALEKINALADRGITRRTPMEVENLLPCDIPYDRDDGAGPAHRASIEASIERMMVGSDNGGYNRLWEFVTGEYASRRLAECGFGGINILHRMASGCTPEQNRVSNPVRFIGAQGHILYEQGAIRSPAPDTNSLAPVSFGTAIVRAGELTAHPFSADHCNYAPLDDMVRLLIALMFPASVQGPSLRLAGDDYRFLRTWMGLLPRESGLARYAAYPDGFKKYFLSGNTASPLAPTLREFNITGRAYGFLSDVAYFADAGQGVEFFLAATIYANANGIINDDIYEYDTVALPFFSDLCSAIYNRELQRKRRFLPDLGEFPV